MIDRDDLAALCADHHGGWDGHHPERARYLGLTRRVYFDDSDQRGAELAFGERDSWRLCFVTRWTRRRRERDHRATTVGLGAERVPGRPALLNRLRLARIPRPHRNNTQR